ncbi:hypothetical protein GCM10009109_00100 [Marinobacterium sediminicola]
MATDKGVLLFQGIQRGQGLFTHGGWSRLFIKWPLCYQNCQSVVISEWLKNSGTEGLF